MSRAMMIGAVALAISAWGCQSKSGANRAAVSKSETPKASSTPEKAPPAPTPPATPPKPEGATAPSAPLDEGTADQMLALKEANEALARGDAAGALAGFINAFDGPTTGASISAGLAAAELLDQQGKSKDAAEIFDRLVQMAPDVPEIRFTAGRFFSSIGDAPRAMTELKRSIALQPDFLPAYSMLGGVMASTGQREKAAELMLNYETRLKRLIDILGNPDVRPHRKVPLIDLFALIDDERSTRALIAAVASPDVEVRLAAADALTHDGAPAALEAIAKATQAETDPIARRALAASLKRAKERMEARATAPTPAPGMPAPTRP